MVSRNENKTRKESHNIDQDQYVKNIVSRFEKLFKHTFKLKDSPLPTSFIPSKKDSPNTDAKTKEVKIRFGDLNYRSIIGALLYVSATLDQTLHMQLTNLQNFLTILERHILGHSVI